MELTKRQEKQLTKVFDNPKKLRKWIDEVYRKMQQECYDKIKEAQKKNEEQTDELISQYLNIYSVTVAFTAHYILGLGKKRLPEFMEKVWNNIDCFNSGHLSLQDCIDELEQNGIKFDKILRYPGQNKNLEEKENE